jgi:hypothetical protein
VNTPEIATMIGKICAYAALVLVAALGALQAAPIASPPADLIRDDVSKAWCWRDRGESSALPPLWYGIRGHVHCTRDLARSHWALLSECREFFASYSN